MGIRCKLAVIVIGLATLSGTSSLSAQDPPAPRIYWTHSGDQAMTLARQFDMPILVFVSSGSCGYCRKMEREVWSNPDIMSMVEASFVPLELDAERDAALVSTLGVRAFPTTLIFSPDGKPIQVATGFQRSTQIAAILRGSASNPAVQLRTASADIQNQRTIRWQHSVDAAVALAQRSQMPIVVFVHSDDCGHCRKMELEVWSSLEIVAMVETGFIPLELNAERDSQLVASLNVGGYPTTILYSPDAEYLTSAVGYLPPDQLAALLRGGRQSHLASQQVAQGQ